MAQDDASKIKIPDTPPPGSGATQGALKGIAALKKAMAEVGFESPYAVAAILAIAGGESKWIPQEEKKYTEKNLLRMGINAADAAKYGRPDISKPEFFGWFYGVHKKYGVAESANYFGRGFIQLTFLSNYKRYAKLSGLDLVNKPELLSDTSDEGYAACAKVCALYLADRAKNWKTEQWKPSFMDLALKAVGGVTDHWPEKRKYFTYFTGGIEAPPPTRRDPTTTTTTQTSKEIKEAPSHKKEAYTEPRSDNFSKIGFTDPEGKYPLRDYMNEPDTNRLARGIMKGTHIEFKDSSRRTGIPIANSTATYDQPISPFNSIYPYNKVFESECGHVLEFDDSINGERINLYHKKGTFIEIDQNGTQVNYIVGDGYYITESNGNVFINGTCNVTIASDLNLLCQGNANVEVCGKSDIVVHSDVNLGVAKDLNIAVGGDMNVLVEGNYNVEVGKTSNMRTVGTMSMESNDALKLKTQKNISMEGGDTQSTAETLMKLSGDIKIETDGAYQIKAKSIQFDTTETLKLNATGQLSAKGSKINLNDPDETIDALEKLGAKKKPVDFKGDTKSDSEEHVLVDTSLNPAGDFNPNSLKKSVVDTLIGGGELPKEVLGLFGNVAPNIYDPKYADSPLENKTSLKAAGATQDTYAKLKVPEYIGSLKGPQDNLKSIDRLGTPSFKYENEDDWNTPAGKKLAAETENTSDYKHNHSVPESDASYEPSGTLIPGKGLSAEKIAEINARDEFPLSYQLSKHFTLGMLTLNGKYKVAAADLPTSGSTKRDHYTVQDMIGNMAALCENCLEPIYEILGAPGDSGKWRITSGFRTEGAVAQSKATSDHNKGRACDFQLTGRNSVDDLYDLCVKLEGMLPYNQLLMEYASGGSSRWIHVAYSTKGNKHQVMTFVDHTKHSNGIQKLYGK